MSYSFPKPQTTQSLKHTLSAMGDSLTDNFTLCVPPESLWPERLADKLRKLGCLIKARNFGRSGNTTQNVSPQMLYRFARMTTWETPDIACIKAGVNDPGVPLTSAQTTANIRTMTLWLKFGCRGTVAGQANLPTSGKEGDRYVVISDTSSTGGVAAVHPWQATTITGAGGSAQTVWEYRQAGAGEIGWGRIATSTTAPTHCKRIVIVSTQFLNFSNAYTDGTQRDTTATKYAAYDDVTGVRSAEIAAANAENTGAAAGSVIYCDYYAFLRNRILAGTDAAGGFSWHVADGNQHENAYGHDLCAQAVLATIQAQTGWVNAIQG